MEYTPVGGRPYMPGYGVGEGPGETLPWSWAEERLEAARNYWLSTVNEDGSPHAMAVWAVWFEGEAWFSTGSQSRKARNLARDSRCTMTMDRADEAVIVNGVARFVAEDAVPAGVNEAYAAKYGEPPPGGGLFAITPGVVFGFIERADQFSRTATRWTFATS